MTNRPFCIDKALLSQRWIYCMLLLLFTSSAYAQPDNKHVSQRFSMKVDDLFDLGFIDEKKSYTNTASNSIKEVFEGKAPEFEFRIRTNEPFRLTVQTVAEDSLGKIDADSLLQISFRSEDGGRDEGGGGFKDIHNKPEPLLKGDDDNYGRVFNIQYRAKPGAALPPDLEKLSLLFTASYP